MKNIDINELLAKYWDAETSVVEETTLRQYFLSNEVQDEHKEYEPLFKGLHSDSAVLSSEFKWNTPSVVSKSARVFRFTKVIRAAAAVMVLALASVFVFQSPIDNSQAGKATIVNIEDPEEALEYTKQALAMLSKNYRKGRAHVANVSEVSRIEIIK